MIIKFILNSKLKFALLIDKEKDVKILIVSDSPKKQTGFGHQVRDLHTMFTALGHEIVFVGMHSEIREGTAIEQYKESKIYSMQGPKHPAGVWQGSDKHWIQSACLIEEPDLILLVWDLRKLTGIVHDFDRFFRCPVYLYWLFDSPPISHQYIQLMKETRVRILPVSKCISNWLSDAAIRFDFRPIPEPVDLSKFYPLPDEIRQRLKLTHLGEHAKRICFGYVGGNFQRKNIPFIIDAFASLPQGVINGSVLFLHTDPTAHQRNASSYDLHGMIDAYHPELKDRIIFSNANNDLAFNMCEIYNVMDWQISGTTGEGFGLCTLEGMACGVPMIIGDISTSEEILGDVGFRIPISGAHYTPNPYLRITVPDFGIFVKAMDRAFVHCITPCNDFKFPDWDIRSHTPKTANFQDIRKSAVERAKLFDIQIVQKYWKEFFELLNLGSDEGVLSSQDAQFPRWSKELVNEFVTINPVKTEDSSNG